jgi:hypothetical protein
MPLLLALFLLVSATAAAAQTTRVIDGEPLSWTAIASGFGYRRGRGRSDLPARRSDPHCGDDATAALRAVVDGRELTCVERNIDRYTVRRGRPGHWQGWALDYQRYRGGAYAAEQLEAERTARAVVGFVHSAVGVARSEVTVRRGEEARRMLPARPARHQPRRL